MHLVFLCTSGLDDPSPRGRWLPLARELTTMGHRVTLLLLHHSFGQLASPHRSQNQQGVWVVYVNQMHVAGTPGHRRYFSPLRLGLVALQGALSLATWAIRLRPDVIHIAKPQPINGLAGLLATRILRCPWYVDCDDYEAGGNRFSAPWQRRVVQLWEDYLPRCAAGVTVNTRFLQQRYQAMGVAPECIVYVPNGVAAEHQSPPDPRRVAGLRVALGLEAASVVLYVGTMSQVSHHVGLLLEAFRLVAREVPTAHLLLVGDGDDRPALEQQARQMGLHHRCTWTGPVPYQAIPVYLRLAACSVDPVVDNAVARSRSPLKIVESLAAGTPVVTGDVGDRREMLADGAAGLLVPPGSAQALAEGIGELLCSDALRGRMAPVVQQQARHYDWSVLAEHWLQVYATPCGCSCEPKG